MTKFDGLNLLLNRYLSAKKEEEKSFKKYSSIHAADDPSGDRAAFRAYVRTHAKRCAYRDTLSIVVRTIFGMKEIDILTNFKVAYEACKWAESDKSIANDDTLHESFQALSEANVLLEAQFPDEDKTGSWIGAYEFTLDKIAEIKRDEGRT